MIRALHPYCICECDLCLIGGVYKIWHELFSRNGLTFWLENPTSRQSSCSCSVTYFTISAHAWDTGIRWIFASRRNCSTKLRCCCKLLAIRSIWAVSESLGLVLQFTLLTSIFRKIQKKFDFQKYDFSAVNDLFNR